MVFWFTRANSFANYVVAPESIWTLKKTVWMLYNILYYTLTKMWLYVSLHAVMVLFRTIAFWRTLLCWNGSLMEFRVICSHPFVFFQICNCQSTSLLVSFLKLDTNVSLHLESVPKQTCSYLLIYFLSHTSVCSSAKLQELISSSALSN